MRRLQGLLILSLFATAAHAGAVLQVSSRDLPSGKAAPSEAYYAQDGMMRIDQLDARGSPNKVDLIRDGVIWEFNPQQRTYTRIDQATVKSYFGAQGGQYEAMLSKLPPDKRALMQARLAQMQKPNKDDTFTDTGRDEQVGQYSCRVWQEQRSAHPYAEYCVVSAASLPGGAELAVSMKKAFETADPIFGAAPMLARGAEHLTRLESMRGFPVRWRYISSSGQPDRESLLTSAAAQALPADKFAIPQGFTEKPLGKAQSD